MTSSKTKRMAAVTALSASLLVGGVAAAQAHDTDSPVCVGKGRGEGTGAPSGKGEGNGKGKGEGTGAPGKGKGKGEGTGAPSALHRCKDHDHGTGSENPGTGSENPGGEVGGNSDNDPVNVDVDVNVDVNLPDAGDLAEQAAQDVMGTLTPAAVNAVGQTLETADEATERINNDLSAVLGLLDSAMAGATNLEAGSVDAGLNVSQDGAAGTINVMGATSGIASLTGQLAESTFGIVGGTTTGVTGLVPGILFAI